VKLGQGRENTRDYLIQHPEVASEIEKQVRAAAGSSAGLGVGVVAEIAE
jgi:hypothetical protein